MLNFFRDIVVGIKLALNSASVAQVKSQIQATLTQATQSAGAVRNVGLLGNAVTGLSRQVRQLGLAFMTYLGGRQLLNFLRSATEEFIKFDRGLQRSIAIMEDATASIREEMSQTALQISRELNIAASDISEAYYFLASAGLSAEQSLKAMPAVALFAKAGLVDLNTATELLAQSQSALGMRTEDATENLAQMVRLMDVLAKADNESQASLTEFAAALTNKAGASLRLFGKTVEEGAAALAILADQGVKGRLAGERLDIFLRQVTQSAIKHADVFQRYGIAVFDTNGKMRNLADIADDLTTALGHLSDEQQVVALDQLGFQVRTVAVIKQFIGMGDAIRDYEEKFKQAGGTTRQMADVQLKAAGERLGLLTRKFEEAKISLGESLIPTLEEFATVAGDESNPTSIINAVKRLAHWLGGGGGSFLSGTLGAALNMLAWVLMEVFDGLSMIGNLITMVVNPPLIVLGAITTAVSLVFGAFTRVLGDLMMGLSFGQFGKSLQDAGNWMMKFAEQAASFTGGRVENVVQNFEEFVSTAKRTFDRGAGTTPNRPTGITRGLRGSPPGAPPKPDGPDMPEDEEANQERLDAERRLLDKLADMRARFNNDNIETNALKLARLERDFAEYYGNRIPASVRQGLDEIRRIIGEEAVFNEFARQFDEMQEDIKPDTETLESISVLHAQLIAMRDSVDESTQVWEDYNELIQKVERSIRSLGKELDKEAKDNQDKRDKEIEDRLERIRRIGEHTADRMADAFGNFFNVLFIGSRRGIDAFEALGRGMLAAMLAPLSDWAMIKSRKAFGEAAEQFAYGIAAASNPLTRSQAPGHFLASAKFAGVGTLWAALGGGVGMAASAIRSGTPGLGQVNPRRTRYDSSSRVDDSRRTGPDIHIFIDGVDPSSARHQNLIGKAIQGYEERHGGSLRVTSR